MIIILYRNMVLNAQGRYRPAFEAAFCRGYMQASHAMIPRLKDFDSFTGNLAGLSHYVSEYTLRWQIQLLPSSGLSKWEVKKGPNLLNAACWSQRMNLVLFALEIAGIGPDS